MAVVVTRIDHASERGRWTLVRARPAAALAGLAVEYQGYREWTASVVLRRETPASIFPVILNLGAPFRVQDAAGAWEVPRAGFAAGLYDRSALVASTGRAHCLQIDLTPLGARRLFRLDLDALRNRVLPLEDLLGQAALGLVAALAEAPSWAVRFARVDAFLLARIAGSRPAAPAIAWAWDRLTASGGRLPVARLARDAGLSRQGLLDGFRREIGAAPKLAARILRFERAVRLIGARPAIGLAELAQACGYADQPHLNREFREFAATSPVALRAALLPDGTGLVLPAA